MSPKPPMPSWLPFVAPFALFLALTSLEPLVPGHYALVYTLKLALVLGLTWALRRGLPLPRLTGREIAEALLLGAALTWVWVTVDPMTPHFSFLFGHRIGYNPFHDRVAPFSPAVFLTIRFFGLVLVAPLVEELFYRGFLLRFVTDMDDFNRVPVGTFSTAALAINVVVFALSHPEWLAAALFALAMCFGLARTRKITFCILAHAITNVVLGFYILHTQRWYLW